MRPALLLALMGAACGADGGTAADGGPPDAYQVAPCAVRCDPGACPEPTVCRGDGYCHNLRDDELCPPPPASACECQDQDADDADSCPTTCRVARCGDGFVRAQVEECDDGNAVPDDGCTTACRDCTVPADGRVSSTSGVCFHRHDAAAIWSAADDACASTGGRLAELRDQQELAEAVTALGDAPVSIGVYWGSSGWTGISGRAPPVAPWAPGQPSCAPCTSSDRVHLRPDGQWETALFSTPAPYLCEQRPRWSIRPVDRHAYGHPAVSTFDVAEANCVGLGGHLASIGSAEEQVFVQGVGGRAWIGLTDAASEGAFAWTSGEPVTFQNWSTGMPDGGIDGNCGLLISSTPYYGAWLDVSCDAAEWGLCELE